MNSKQRRKDRRKWKFYACYNDVNKAQYDKMWDWCVANFGRTSHCRWRERFGYVGDFWEFDNEQDYILFVLRWGASRYEQ